MNVREEGTNRGNVIVMILGIEILSPKITYIPNSFKKHIFPVYNLLVNTLS